MNTAVFWGVTACSLAEVCHADVSDSIVTQEAANVNKFLSKYVIPGVISQATVIFPEQTAAVM